MDVFSLVATLELQADNFFSGLADAAEAMIQFGTESLETSMTFDKSMSHVKAISGSVTGSVEQQTKYMEQLTKTAKEMGLQFETAADNTETAMNIINSKAAALGHDTIFTAAEVGDAFGYMAMAGWDYQEMLEGIDAVVSLAAASGEDLARTSDIVTDALTAFGMKASEAVDFADLIAITAAKANTNVNMMGESFKYVAPIAGAYGISAEDTAEALGLMANNGVKASMAGTALRRILSNIAVNNGASSNSAGSLDIVEMLGVDFYDAEGKIRDMSEFFGDLREAWHALDSDTQRQAEYAKKIAGQYGMSAFLALMNSTDEDIQKIQEGIQNRVGASSEMMNTMTDNLWGDVEKYKSAFDAVKRTIGEELTPMARDFTQYGTESWDTLLLAYGEGGLAALPDAIKDVVKKGSDLIDQYLPEWEENGTKILDAISAGIQAASDGEESPLGKVIGSLGDMIGKFLNDNAGTITETVATFIGSITPGILAAIEGIWDGIAASWPQISSKIGDMLNKYGIQDWFRDNFTLFGIGDMIANLLDNTFPGTQSTGTPSAGGSKPDVKTENIEDYKARAAKSKTWSESIMDQLEKEHKEQPMWYDDIVMGLFGGLTGAKPKSQREADAVLAYAKELDKLDIPDTWFDPEKLGYNGEFEISASFIDGVSEPAHEAMTSLADLYNYIALEYNSSSNHEDHTSEKAILARNALEELITIIDQDGDRMITESDHNDNTSEYAWAAYEALTQLFTFNDDGTYTYSEHDGAKAISVISEVLSYILQLEGKDGYTSHTQSIHDEITNVITRYYDEKSNTSTVVNSRTGTAKYENVLNARSMSGGTILRGATLFGWDAQGNPQIGGGEGPEAVVGVGSLNQQIREAVRDGMSGIVGAIAGAVQGDDRKYVIVLDTGALVGGIAHEMDAELARLGNWTAGGAA